MSVKKYDEKLMEYVKESYAIVPNCYRLHKLSDNAQLVFVWICILATHDDVGCFEMPTQLDEKMKMPTNDIIKSIDELIEKEFLMKTLVDGKTIYTMLTFE